MEDREIELLMEKITAPYGMILLTGPTGSGKTTTLYAALSILNSGDINILTVEDPVEYKIPGVYQMQANEKIGLTFAAGLRTMLRQDPDVIMVGEIRDNETAEIAVRAALTGHIVFSTLHTNDAIGIVLRLTDMDIEPFLVASALTLAIAQRLYRTICEDCRTYVEPRVVRERLQEEGITQSRLKRLGLQISEDREYAIGKGCPKCKGTGYYGRRALFEMFNVTQEAKDLIISKDFTESALKTLAKQQGMTTLLHAGRRAVEKGLTTIEEVIRVCRED
jgi:type II secretory ATPase GspE/PulE/Tfp pilus assembly ATPase PilB-like protein